MKKKAKIQYPYSNRHGMPVTNKDKTKIQEAYQDAKTIFDSMPLEELEKLGKTNQFEGKKLTGSKARALRDSIQYHTLSKFIKTENETTAQA